MYKLYKVSCRESPPTTKVKQFQFEVSSAHMRKTEFSCASARLLEGWLVALKKGTEEANTHMQTKVDAAKAADGRRDGDERLWASESDESDSDAESNQGDPRSPGGAGAIQNGWKVQSRVPSLLPPKPASTSKANAMPGNVGVKSIGVPGSGRTANESDTESTGSSEERISSHLYPSVEQMHQHKPPNKSNGAVAIHEPPFWQPSDPPDLELKETIITDPTNNPTTSPNSADMLPSARDIEFLLQVFDSLDANHDGHITLMELVRSLREKSIRGRSAQRLGLPEHVRQEDGTRNRLVQIFHEIDTDDSKTITREELLRYALQR